MMVIGDAIRGLQILEKHLGYDSDVSVSPEESIIFAGPGCLEDWKDMLSQNELDVLSSCNWAFSESAESWYYPTEDD